MSYQSRIRPPEDFPILCETCLGDNPYVRMIRAIDDSECNICSIPYTTFRWKAGTAGRLKKTEICPTCAKIKHVCQVCLLDVTTETPVLFRDTIAAAAQAKPALAASLDLVTGSAAADRRGPASQVLRAYESMVHERHVDSGNLPNYDAANAAVASALATLPQSHANARRNRPKLCSFFAKDACNRGDRCPFRHEKPDDQGTELSRQNVRDRYYGVNDPVAAKLLKKVEERKASNTDATVFIGNVIAGRVEEEDLAAAFRQYGKVLHINIVGAQACAYATFATHAEAERAILGLTNNFVVKGAFLKIKWAATGRAAEKVWLYPSMNPKRLGAPIERGGGGKSRKTAG